MKEPNNLVRKWLESHCPNYRVAIRANGYPHLARVLEWALEGAGL